MSAVEKDEDILDPNRETQRPTGRYRIKPLPQPVEVPEAAKGTQWEPLAHMMRATEDRRDALEHERRFADAAYRTYVDDRLAEQDTNIAEVSALLAQTVGTLHDLGTAVAALKEIPTLVGALRETVQNLKGEMSIVRRCVRKLERDFREVSVTVQTTSAGQSELVGRVLALEVRVQEIASIVHDLEEAVDLREEADAEDPDDESEASDAEPK